MQTALVLCPLLPLDRLPWQSSPERTPVAKTKAQLEKRKREAEKRKKTEKAILKIADGMPDDGEAETTPTPSLDVKPLPAQS